MACFSSRVTWASWGRSILLPSSITSQQARRTTSLQCSVLYLSCFLFILFPAIVASCLVLCVAHLCVTNHCITSSTFLRSRFAIEKEPSARGDRQTAVAKQCWQEITFLYLRLRFRFLHRSPFLAVPLHTLHVCIPTFGTNVRIRRRHIFPRCS